jgi:putative transposase
VQYFNHSYKRTGTLWEGRYKGTLIDSERYLLSCYRFNALGQEDRLIVPHYEYLKLADNAEERQLAYRALFKNHLSEKALTDIRESTNKA